MINIENAKIAFSNFLKNYNMDDGKIALKVKHIYKVSEISRKNAVKNNFNEEEQKLAELIGLLHDIGRFDQIRIYNTFIDYKSENHAELGIKILFKNGLIRKFVEDDKYDEIIKIAILNHNKGKIDDGLNQKVLKFCKVIRDADKLDIFRVLTTEDFKDAYEKEDLSNELVTEEIVNEFMNNKYIIYKNRKTCADIMISHIAYVFDFNFRYCLEKVKNEKYIEKLVKRANYKNKDTIEKMNEIINFANTYMDKRLR